MKAGELNRRVTILERQVTKDATYGTDVINWVPIRTVYAQIIELLPPDAQKISSDVALAVRPARVIMRWRSDLTQQHRVEIDGRQMRIVSGPAMIGLRVGMEIVVQELSTEGQQL